MSKWHQSILNQYHQDHPPPWVIALFDTDNRKDSPGYPVFFLHTECAKEKDAREVAPHQYLGVSKYKRERWYDALCINQDDLEERSHQVVMMQKIYESYRSSDLAWETRQNFSSSYSTYSETF
jgi:hypothetical protein